MFAWLLILVFFSFSLLILHSSASLLTITSTFISDAQRCAQHTYNEWKKRAESIEKPRIIFRKFKISYLLYMRSKYWSFNVVEIKRSTALFRKRYNVIDDRNKIHKLNSNSMKFAINLNFSTFTCWHIVSECKEKRKFVFLCSFIIFSVSFVNGILVYVNCQRKQKIIKMERRRKHFFSTFGFSFGKKINGKTIFETLQIK